MRKIILGLAVSLDGYIEGPNGEFDWCFTDQYYGMTDFLSRIGTIFMGRKSYEIATAMGGENPWKGFTTCVFSNTLTSISAPDTRLVKGDAVKEAQAIRSSPGKDIWLFGGAQLTRSFMDAGLVDELWLSVHPILLGAGKPLFQQVSLGRHFDCSSPRRTTQVSFLSHTASPKGRQGKLRLVSLAGSQNDAPGRNCCAG